MILLLLASSLSFAQSPIVPSKVPQEIFDTKSYKSSQEEVDYIRPHTFKFLGAMNQNQFQQSGTGTTFETGKTISYGLRGSHSYKLRNNRYLQNDLNLMPTGFKNPSSNKRQDYTRYSLSSHYAWERKSNRLTTGLLVGLNYTNRSGQSDSQNLTSSSQSIAPSLGLKAQVNISKRLKSIHSLFINSPIWLNEKKSTGRYSYGYHAQLSNGLSFAISKKFNLIAEFLIEREVLRFKGSGDRSVSNGELTFNSISFPVGVEYEF